MPHQGEGYAGFATYVNHPSFVDAREFLKCSLNYPLIQDVDYYVELYVSQSDSAEYATHNVGVTFTDVDTGEFGELLCWPECEVYVENSSANPLTSKTEWVKVSGTFTALGGEQYIHIGNFRTDADSEIEFIGGGVGPQYDWFIGAYYIDDVWLSHVDSAHYVSVNEESSIDNYVRVFPNPASDVVSIECNMRLEEVSLFDLRGKMIMKGAVAGRKESIDLSELLDGIYFLTLTDDDGNRYTERLVVQH